MDWTTGSDNLGQIEVSDPSQISDCFIWCARKAWLKGFQQGMTQTCLHSYTDLLDLGDNCSQICHLGRYIVGYMVGNLY